MTTQDHQTMGKKGDRILCNSIMKCNFYIYYTSLGLLATLGVPFLWSVCLIKRNSTLKSLGV